MAMSEPCELVRLSGLAGVMLTSAVWLAGCAGSPGGFAEESRQAYRAAGHWRFDEDPVGAVPTGWSIRETNGGGALATWQVAADPTAPSPPNVLCLTRTSNSGHTYNLAIADGTRLEDLELSVRVGSDGGSEDQGGGPIWRCRDANNYYICRINPLEDNYRVYKVVEGRRTQLASAEVETEPGRWYTLRVTMIGDRITCELDGRPYLEVRDDTFSEAGRVGLWTKADAATGFDNLEVRAAGGAR